MLVWKDLVRNQQNCGTVNHRVDSTRPDRCAASKTPSHKEMSSNTHTVSQPIGETIATKTRSWQLTETTHEVAIWIVCKQLETSIIDRRWIPSPPNWRTVRTEIGLPVDSSFSGLAMASRWSVQLICLFHQFRNVRHYIILVVGANVTAGHACRLHIAAADGPRIRLRTSMQRADRGPGS